MTVPDGELTTAAFCLRDNESYLSANWMNGLVGFEDAIEEVRQILKKKQYTVRTSGRFAVLNAGEIRKKLNEVSIRHLPEPDDPSHAGICGMDDMDDNKRLFVAAKLMELVKCGFPGVRV